MTPRLTPPFSAGQLFELQLGRDLVMPFRFIPATGSEGFRMGSRDGPDSWTQKTEQPVHGVRLRGFWMGETPVTQAQFVQWTQDHCPDHQNEFPGHPDHPAENMDWRQAIRYGIWLTEQFGGQFPHDFQWACLPTEAEWEYACRAGTETDYHTGDGEAALAEAGRYDQPYEAGTRPVRIGAENRFGLFDLHGHVWQWCQDVLEETVYRQRVDGDVDVGGYARASDLASEERRAALLTDDRDRVIRGGSWYYSAWWCRSAFRWWRPVVLFRGIGFRVCLVPGPAAKGGAREQPEPAKAAREPGVGGRGTRPETDGAGGAGASENPDLANLHFSGAAGREFLPGPPRP